MAGSATRVDGPSAQPDRARDTTPAIAAFALIAVTLWVATIIWANEMGNMPGTMGMSIPSFVAMWAMMMAAMMLPSVAPMALLYSKTTSGRSPRRLTMFSLGYVLTWTLTGVVAYAMASGAGRLAAEAATAGRAAAVIVFVGVGLYQLTPLKYRCLDHCRSPIGHLFHYANWSGRLRDLRAGAHHGAYCLGCCWALMVLMVAFGVMNVWAMVALAVVVAVEKMWRHGVGVARLAGAASLALAVMVVFEPGVAPGLDPASIMDPNGPMGM